jgi:uncharacterized phiE125 gp8 family phage protein
MSSRTIYTKTPATGLAISLSDAKMHLRVDPVEPGPEDELITNLIRVAQGQAETILRRSLLDQTLVLMTNLFPNSSFFELERGPIRSVIVSYFDDTNTLQVLPDTEYIPHLKSIPEFLELTLGASWPSTYQNGMHSVSIEMQCGYETPEEIPAEILQGIRLMVGYWYSVRENVQIGPGIAPLTIPQGAEWLLWPYRDFRF